jgi:polyhydroxybutyrate depolymerase
MRRWLAVLLAMGVVMLTGCRPGPGEEHDDQADAGSSTWTIESGGASRSYRLYVPATRPDPAPLVLMLHGGFGSAEHAQEHYGWDAAADTYGFVVAYPEGLGRAWAVGGGCCGRSGREGVDDVGFLTAVVADVAERLAIDPDRLYATGMSNGAMMSYRLACDTTIFAAIAPVAGTLLGDCPSPAPISVLHIHGAEDENVRYDGAPGDGVAGIDGPDVPSVVDMWRTVGGCEPAQEVTEGAVTTSSTDCPQGRSVVLVTIAGAGHQWPGSSTSLRQRVLGADRPSEATDATTLIAEFFAAHAREGGGTQVTVAAAN